MQGQTNFEFSHNCGLLKYMSQWIPLLFKSLFELGFLLPKCILNTLLLTWFQWLEIEGRVQCEGMIRAEAKGGEVPNTIGDVTEIIPELYCVVPGNSSVVLE